MSETATKRAAVQALLESNVIKLPSPDGEGLYSYVRNTLRTAAALAKIVHAGQVDKAGAPYSQHIAAVTNSCNTWLEKLVALLHDVIEDGAGILSFETLRKFQFPAVAIEALMRITKGNPGNYQVLNDDRSRKNLESAETQLFIENVFQPGEGVGELLDYVSIVAGNYLSLAVKQKDGAHNSDVTRFIKPGVSTTLKSMKYVKQTGLIARLIEEQGGPELFIARCLSDTAKVGEEIEINWCSMEQQDGGIRIEFSTPHSTLKQVYSGSDIVINNPDDDNRILTMSFGKGGVYVISSVPALVETRWFARNKEEAIAAGKRVVQFLEDSPLNHYLHMGTSVDLEYDEEHARIKLDMLQGYVNI